MANGRSQVTYRRASKRIQRAGMEQFARKLMHEVTGGRSFLCLITDDQELRRLNRIFLKKDWPTDVLSFPAGGKGGDLGEIAISSERAIEQAERLGHSPEAEVRILMLHAALHLMGLDHEKDRGQMAEAEREWRMRFELPPSLTERARG